MLDKLLRPEVLVFLVPICAIVGGVVLRAMKLNFAHEERLAKINAGLDPDAEYDDDDYEGLKLDQEYKKKEKKAKPIFRDR